MIHPFEHAPAIGDGSVIPVAPGVFWLRMPLVGGIPWINVWVLADSTGWAIVDTGVHSSETQVAWESAFQGVMQAAPVTRIFATHLHPDHCGLAGWLTERFDVRLWMSRLEYLACRVAEADAAREAPAVASKFYRAVGWDDAAIERYKNRLKSVGALFYPMPRQYHRLSEGNRLRIGEHEWRIVVGSGHSPEHACLYSPDLKLFISGDQVLPMISSNVGVSPMEPDANPLADWLSSLKHLRTEVTEDVLVLPSHKTPFHGLHERIDELIKGHELSLDKLRAALVVTKRCAEVFPLLFSRAITTDLLTMATAEAMAHLNYLVAEGEVRRELSPDGIWHWQRC